MFTQDFVHRVLVQPWREYERGWGNRPDGCSVHLNEEDRQAFVNHYLSRRGNVVPDDYSNPDGEPYWAEIPQNIYDALTSQSITRPKHGVFLGQQFTPRRPRD